MTGSELARYLDFTLLKPEATEAEVRLLCAEAERLAVEAVCVAPSRVLLAVHLLESTTVKVCTVAGFPLGHEDPDTKRMTVEAAVDNGAQEIDVVFHAGRLRDGDEAYVLRELRDLVEAAEERPIKVVLEMSLLTRDEIMRGCALAVESGARFVATSTGFGSRDATEEDVRLVREAVGVEFGVKAGGGIRDLATALAMVEAGANRIGTSVAGEILRSMA
jgi:deoxyribose-phosphate aldolase